MNFEKYPIENWNENQNDPSLTKEFGKANKFEGEVFYCSNEKNKAIIVIKKKILKIFSRAQIYTNSIDREFLEPLINELKNRKIPYARIGNTMFGINKEIFIEKSQIIKRNTFILDLNKSEEEIWNNFDKKLRNVIRKSEKENVKISEITNEEELKEYYLLSQKTEQDIKQNKGKKTFSIQNYEFFKEIFLNKLARIFVARFEGKIIAGALFLLTKEKSVYYQSCSNRDYKEKQAPSLIQWEAIKKFKKEGIKKYDLGGVTIGLNENDSRYFVYEFKRKFNGELIEFYNIEFELNKFKKIQDYLIKKIYKV